MKATRFWVRNFRNIDDSGWIALDTVTAFVGRNESGKTTLLRALHKFNPGSPEAYNPQREFPRDRYTSDYIAGGSLGDQWPVCSVEFEFSDDIQADIRKLVGEDQDAPMSTVATRYYDGHITFEYEPPLAAGASSSEPLRAALETFASSVGELEGGDEASVTEQREALFQWSNSWRDRLQAMADVKTDAGVGASRGASARGRGTNPVVHDPRGSRAARGHSVDRRRCPAGSPGERDRRPSRVPGSPCSSTSRTTAYSTVPSGCRVFVRIC